MSFRGKASRQHTSGRRRGLAAERLEPRRMLAANVVDECVISSIPYGFAPAGAPAGADDAPDTGPADATVPPSGDYRIEALRSGYKWGVTNVTFSFYSGVGYYGSEGSPRQVSEAVKSNVRAILTNVIAPLINVTFTEVPDSATSYGLIRYLCSTSPGYAYAYYPFAGDTNALSSADVAGDVVLNTAYDVVSTDTNSFQNGPGSHGYQSLIHETCHALGLKHPGDYNGSGTGSGPFLPLAEDNWDNSLMSYNFYSGFEPATPMAYDLQALQYIYGAKTSTRSADSIYTFARADFYTSNDGAIGGTLSATTKDVLWDGGGTDTADLSGLPSATGGYRIDIRSGGWITPNSSYNGTGYAATTGSPTSFSPGNTYRATTYGTRLPLGGDILENVVVSRYADTLYLNSLSNRISGYVPNTSSGGDTIYSSDKSDTLDLSQFLDSAVGKTQTGNDLVLNLGTAGTITVKDYFAVTAANRIVIVYKPTITITSDVPTVKVGQTALITFSLSETATDFTEADVVVRGGTLSGFSGGGKTYTATFTAAANATSATISVAADTFSNMFGAGNVGGTLPLVITGDTVPPTLTIASSATTLRAGQTATITFALSEPSTDFTAADVAVTGGTLSGFTGSGTSYTATFTPTVNSTAPGTISVAAGTFQDVAGNGNIAATLSPAITIETILPTIAIASSATSLGIGQTAVITFTLSEAATDFTLSDVTVTGGTLSGFAGSGTSYSATFTPTVNSTAPGTIAVAPGVFTDPAGNPNAAASLSPTIAINTLVPTVTIASSTATLRAGQTAAITFTLSEFSTNFTAADVAVSGGTLTDFTGSGTLYSATFVPSYGSNAAGTISVAAGAFTNTSGVPCLAGSLSPSITIDTLVPGIVIASNATALRAGQTATITFTLSEPVGDFTAADISVSGGSLSGFTGSGTSYSATFSPAAGSTAPGVISVAAGSFADAAGNPGTAGSLTPSIVIDTVIPTIQIASTTSTLRAGQTATIAFTLDRPATDFTATDVTVTGGTLSDFSGSGTYYFGIFTPLPGSIQPGTISVAAATFTSEAGNPNSFGQLVTPIAINTVRPAIAIAAATTALKAGQSATISFVLSEAAVDFTLDDVVASGGVLSGFAGSGTSYTSTFTPSAGFAGTGTVSVAAGAFTGVAGNPNTPGALTAAIAINTVLPSAAISASSTTLLAGQTATITFTLSESATDFTAADVGAVGGTLSGFAGSGTNYSATFTPQAAFTGVGRVTIAAGAFTGTVGNPSSATALTPTIAINTVLPTIAISSSTVTLRSGQTATIAFTLSEAATDFSAADVTAIGGELSGFAGSGAAYTAIFTPTAGFTGPGMVSVAANAFVGTGGNQNAPGALAAPLAIDTVAPAVAIASSAATLRSGQTATVTFTLSEAATNFVVGDVSVSGGSLSNFSGSGTSYSATFTPTAAFTGPGTISVAAATFTDAAGNDNTAGSLSPPIAIDTVAPTIIAFGSSTPNGSYGIDAVIALSATVSEPVQAGSSILVTLGSGATATLTALEQGTLLTGTYRVSPGEATADLDITAFQPSADQPLRDLAGNALVSTTLPAAPNRLKDTADIVIAGGISATATGFSSTATNVPDKKTAVLSIPITFNTPVTGVTLGSFRLSLNGRSVSLTGATLSGSGAAYTLKLPSGRTSLKGVYSLQILPAGIRATANQAAMTTASTISWGNGASVTPRTRAFATV